MVVDLFNLARWQSPMIVKKLIQGRCWLCFQPLMLSHHGICSFCLPLIRNLPEGCSYCGLPTSQNEVCYQCQLNPPPWECLMAVSSYEYPLKWLIHRLKFKGHTELSYGLSRLLLLKWVAERRARGLTKPDIVLPVPLFRYRQWRRGFNQSALLAKPLAKWLEAEYNAKLLVRNEARRDQKQLTAKSRQSNLKRVFRCKEQVTGKRILLVDDIVTTGSTVNEICELLKKQNPHAIQIICLCRTL